MPATPTTRIPAPTAAPTGYATPVRHGGTPAHTIGAVVAIALVLIGFAAGSLGLQWLLAESHGPAPRPAPAPLLDRPGWSLQTTEDLRLAGQAFDVEHAQVGEDAADLAYFSAHIEVAPKITALHDTGLPDGTRGDALQVYLSDSVTTSDVIKRDPLGLAKVGWEEDLLPLPNYGYQAIAGGVAHFDDGTTVAVERGTSFQLVFPVPAGARSVEAVDLDFDWLDQGRTLHFVP